MAHIVAVDSNIWVSAFISPRGNPARFKTQWQANRFDVVVSVQLLSELVDVLNRPRLQRKYGYAPEEIATYVRLLSELANVVTVSGKLGVSRDLDDDVLLETAIVGHATVVVSGDKDITQDPKVAEYLEKRTIRVMTVQQFLMAFEQIEDAE